MGSINKIEEFDLLIVGTGVAGLPMAKTYLEVHPSATLLILESNYSIGGTWAAERLYEGLQSNNLVGMLEYSDFPMDFETFGVEAGKHVPGTVYHDYLTAYAKKFGVFERVRFGCTVVSAELLSNKTWEVIYVDKNKKEKVKVKASKMVLATGTTSKPKMPVIKGRKLFEGHMFHSKELPFRNADMAESKNVAVLGGSKSACDAVYMNASNGRHVDWIIRASGKGPAWLCWPYVSPFSLQFEALPTIRLMSLFSPSFERPSIPFLHSLLHNTRLGRAFVRGFFSIIHGDLLSGGKFNEHPETKKLIPPGNVFWSGTSVGIFNYPVDFFSLIRKGMINVHIADVTHLSPNTVHLSGEKELDADTLVCATGWEFEPSFEFLPSSLGNNIGLSVIDPRDERVRAADAELFTRYPELKDQPPALSANGEKEKEPGQAYTLFRSAIPPAFLHDRNLAYIGMAISLRGCMTLEIQSLWIVAFLDGRLPFQQSPQEGGISTEEAEWEALLQSRFYRWRAPMGLGGRTTDMVFEIMPFVDKLLRELGVETRRKQGVGEWIRSYGVGDYRGFVREWMEKQELVKGMVAD
ncbi:flavin-binding monooxygenase-like family protein [Tricladium varicosporioides]|nr:flavin-binding monooxygenase-like family protein [Hymenoscyphus varicosporioides]